MLLFYTKCSFMSRANYKKSNFLSNFLKIGEKMSEVEQSFDSQRKKLLSIWNKKAKVIKMLFGLMKTSKTRFINFVNQTLVLY